MSPANLMRTVTRFMLNDSSKGWVWLSDYIELYVSGGDLSVNQAPPCTSTSKIAALSRMASVESEFQNRRQIFMQGRLGIKSNDASIRTGIGDPIRFGPSCNSTPSHPRILFTTQQLYTHPTPSHSPLITPSPTSQSPHVPPPTSQPPSPPLHTSTLPRQPPSQ
jgi:hypothetical protein